MKSVLAQNQLLNAKQSFLLGSDFLTGILSCGEWAQERGVIELEDHTRRITGISEPFDFDIEYDLANLDTRRIMLEWWKYGNDAGSTTPGGDPKGIDQKAYRTIVRTYHASIQSSGPDNPSFKLVAYNCCLKGSTHPEFAMKSTDPGKGKVSVISDYYDVQDLQGNILSSIQVQLAKAIPNLPGSR